MKKIPTELKTSEQNGLPTQEFRFSVSLKLFSDKNYTNEQIADFVNTQLNNITAVGQSNINCMEEFCNRSLDAKKLTESQLIEALTNNGETYRGTAAIKKALKNRETIQVYWNADREKILAYIRY